VFNNLLPKKYAEFIGLGAEIAVSIAGPILAGHFVDSYFGWYPWGLFSGIILGLITFLFTMIRISKKIGSGNE
jgi:F0F1-type ATP synthase assembly protein I